MNARYFAHAFNKNAARLLRHALIKQSRPVPTFHDRFRLCFYKSKTLPSIPLTQTRPSISPMYKNTGIDYAPFLYKSKTTFFCIYKAPIFVSAFNKYATIDSARCF